MLRHLLVYTDEAGRARYGDELGALGNEFATVDVKVAADGIFPHLGATLAQRSGINLLQGYYAPKSNWLALARPWRLAASLLVALVALALVHQAAEFWQLRRTNGALEELITSGCTRVVGDGRISACQREVQQRLGAGATSTGSEDFLSTLAAIAAVRNPSARIDALSYRNRVMNLQMIAANVPALDEFERGLEQTRRFAVEIEAANQIDGGTEGRMRIVGASP
jgi:type II secretion system protein L